MNSCSCLDFFLVLHRNSAVLSLSPRNPRVAFKLRGVFAVGIVDMDILALCLVVQLCLAFGVAGLFWPEKIRPLFDVLMFPWAATYRSVRANSIAAIGLSILLIARLFAVVR